MSYIIKVPAYPIGKELLQKTINRLMNELQATHYVVGEGQISNDGYSIDYKVAFTLNK